MDGGMAAATVEKKILTQGRLVSLDIFQHSAMIPERTRL